MSSKLSFYDELVAHKLIVPVGVPGAFGRGPVFENVLARFDAAISRVGKGDGAERFLFPPILDRKVLEKSEFLDSFPQLAGSVFSFTGGDAQHGELRERLRDGQPWGDLQSMTGVVLSPAACYPVYPSLAGTLPDGGRTIDMQNWVFRHEPSPEPTRMQAFRVREHVRARSVVASDPFFGRGGRMLAASQREQALKFEVVVPILSEEAPTAICSFNYHHEHFGKIFGIKTTDGAVAQTACLGFGMERVVMALFRTHGFVPAEWPLPVLEALGP